MKYHKTNKNLIFLLLTACLCLYTLLIIIFDKIEYDNIYYNRSFSTAHYLAFGAIALNVLIYFKFKNVFKKLFGITLLLGLFNTINFIPNKTSIGAGPLIIQPLSLLFVIVFYFLNKSSINKFFRAYILPYPNPKRLEEDRKERVAKFKSTFAKKSDESLREIVHKQALVPDALEAAKQLLQERGTRQPQ